MGMHSLKPTWQLNPLHVAARMGHEEACKVILEVGWGTEEINVSSGPDMRTPLLQSAHWNRPGLFQLLLSHGADVHALCNSPFEEGKQRTWSALHLMAHQRHNDAISLVDDIVGAGLPVDGDPEAQTETAFNVAVRRNGFKLADKLLSHGACTDAMRRQSGHLIAPQPLTVLGHEIARNSRYGMPALRYLLALCPRPSFVVEPESKLTALHLVALVPDGFSYAGGGSLNRNVFDWETNRATAHELIVWFAGKEELNARCSQGKTALHLAKERGNLGVLEELVRAGACLDEPCDMDKTPSALCEECD
jgi:ankyrin repeat protein